MDESTASLPLFLFSYFLIMLTPERQIGNLGEDLAKKYLQKKNYTIVESNYYSKFGEVDIIARVFQEVDWLVFIEIKTRAHENSQIFGYPEELVDYSKERKISATAARYMDEKNFNPDHWRLDIIVVDLNMENRRARIRHFENV